MSNEYSLVPFFKKIPNEWFVSIELDREIVIKALKLLEEIFNDSWKNEQECSEFFNRHPLYPIRRDYFFFEKMVKLGTCLINLLKIENIETYFKKLRNSGEFFHSETLIRVAGTFKGEGYDVCLEPAINHSKSDLVIKFNDVKVFLEIKTIGSESKEDRKKNYILTQIEQYIFGNRQKLPVERFLLYFQVKALPQDDEVEKVIQEVIEELNKKIGSSEQFPWLIKKKGIIVELGGKRSYSLRNDIIKAFKEAIKQLPSNQLGIVIIRFTNNFQWLGVEKGIDEISKNLDEELKDKNNILGVMIFAPYKGSENERLVDGFKKYFIENKYLEKNYDSLTSQIKNLLNEV